MIPFHSLFPELAQREVRCLHFGPGPGPPADEYVFSEYYCDDLACDCRRVFFQVISKLQPDKVWASINYGWEKESFYRKKIPYDPDAARRIVRGHLDPLNEQSEYAQFLLEAFQRLALDEPYRLRLRRHHQLFRDELARRARASAASGSTGGA